MKRCPSAPPPQGMSGLSSISVGDRGRGHKRHRSLHGPAHLAEMQSLMQSPTEQDVPNVAWGRVLNVPVRIFADQMGLRQNRRTANGEVARYGTQTGENVPSPGLTPAHREPTSLAQSRPPIEQPPARLQPTPWQQRRAERDRVQCRSSCRSFLPFFDVHRPTLRDPNYPRISPRDFTSMNPKAFQVGG